MRSNPLRDLFATIPKAAKWHPLEGALRLGVDDLRQGHRKTRAVLEKLSENTTLVRRKGGKKKAIVFEFDSYQLYCALQSVAYV
jgi:hypothetical protein